MNVAEVNTLSQQAYMEAFGPIAEHSPWVAESAGAAAPFADRQAMIDAFQKALLQSTACWEACFYMVLNLSVDNEAVCPSPDILRKAPYH